MESQLISAVVVQAGANNKGNLGNLKFFNKKEIQEHVEQT